jgi:hypothetical protein
MQTNPPKIDIRRFYLIKQSYQINQMSNQANNQNTGIVGMGKNKFDRMIELFTEKKNNKKIEPSEPVIPPSQLKSKVEVWENKSKQHKVKYTIKDINSANSRTVRPVVFHKNINGSKKIQQNNPNDRVVLDDSSDCSDDCSDDCSNDQNKKVVLNNDNNKQDAVGIKTKAPKKVAKNMTIHTNDNSDDDDSVFFRYTGNKK